MLTEEVQRAVYVVKGLVLIASSALAYFLSRALLAQLMRTLQGFPLMQQAARASEAAAAAAKQAQPGLQQRASALLERLPGRSTGQRERDGVTAREGLAGGRPAEQPEARRGQVAAESATNVLRRDGQRDRQRDGGGGGPRAAVDMASPGNVLRPESAGASPPPLPLVPTASAALYAMNQGARNGSKGVQRRKRLPNSGRTAIGTSENAAVRDAGLGEAVPLPVIDEVDLVVPERVPGRLQRGGGAAPVADEGPGGGVLWKRGSGRQASLLSSRWAVEGQGSAGGQGASAPAVVGGEAGEQEQGESRSPGGVDITFRSSPRRTGGDTGSNMDAVGDRMQSVRAHIDSDLSKTAGQAGIANGGQGSGSGRDPWFG